MKRIIITFFALLPCCLVQSQSLGGVDLSRFVYGGNTTKTNYFNNPNDWYSSGFYNNSTGTNMPYQTWWHLIINRHVNESNNYQFQIAADFWGDNTYFRKLQDGNPTPWRRILNDGQDPYAANLNQFLRTTDQVSFSSLGIGTNNPGVKLDILSGTQGTLTYSMFLHSGYYQDGSSVGIGFGSDGTASYAKGGIVYDATNYGGWNRGDIKFLQRNSGDLIPAGLSDAVMTIKNTGNVGIGTTNPSDKLSVNGNIRSKKVIVTQNGWADYVFNDGYRLRPLAEIESFIKENKHLPEVPTAKEVDKNGIDVGETETLLLKKIEELTLYMIEMKKENEKMKKDFESEIKELKQKASKRK